VVRPHAQVTLCVSCLLRTPSHSLLCPHHSETHTHAHAHRLIQSAGPGGGDALFAEVSVAAVPSPRRRALLPRLQAPGGTAEERGDTVQVRVLHLRREPCDCAARQRVGVFGRSIIPTVVHSHLVEATLTPSRLPAALRVHRHKRRTSHLARLALRLPLLQLIGRPRSTHNNKLPAGRYRRHLVSAAAGGRAHGEHCHPHPPPCLLAAHPHGVGQCPQHLGENARLAQP
jgi:hypothetical protein